MGNHHGDKWRRALPWVLLGKRIAYQPDLDTSSALLAFGRSPLIPGQLLGDPGPPLNSLQIKALLEELYRLESRPAMQTSSNPKTIDISATDNVSHVYVKVDEPQGLSRKFEGPYEIVSRPSRSQVQVRVGSYASGEPRFLTFHWSACKPAHIREGAQLGERPRLGRPPNLQPQDPQTRNDQSVPNPPTNLRPIGSESERVLTDAASVNNELVPSTPSVNKEEPAKIQNALPQRPVRSSRNPNPRYV